MNIEFQQQPLVNLEADCVEIDRASADVDMDPYIDPQVFEFFHLIIDPSDMRNKWLQPLPDVRLLDRFYEVVEEEELAIDRLRMPNGMESFLIYRYSRGGDRYRWSVHLETSGQLMFGLE